MNLDLINTALQRGEDTPRRNGNGFNRFPALAALGALTVALTLYFARGDGVAPNYTVHEWGTFTSVQGGDGQLLPWRPLQTSELPRFVYDWSKAGLNRGGPIIFKGGMITLQRMETPVMYFYSDQPMSVDVNVAFPRGTITEWYPQASQIGPALVANSNLPSEAVLNESRAVWKKLQITPPTNSDETLLPQDTRGSHYF